MSLVTSIQRGGSSNHETTSEEANGVYTDFVSQGVLGTIANTSGVAPATGAYAVNAQGTPDMTVAVTAGTAYVTATPSTQASQTFRVVNSASANVTIAANSSGSTKYDWIYLKLDATNLNNPNVAGDDAATLVASRSSSISSDDGTPPTYGILLAIVTVSNGAVTITNGNIKDSRTQASIGASTSDSTGWFNLGATPNTITALGNRSYTVVFNSTDLTDTVSAGMRLRLTRTVSAPTQCADLESGSSQHFVVTNAVGLATGTTWTFKCKIKPESYTASTLIAIDDGTNLVELALNASGQIFVLGGTHATNDVVTSYQSVVLGKWQEVTGSITIGTPTGEIRIDDVVVPSFVTASAATTMTISGDEEIYIGRLSSGGYFDGKICQVALFNSIVSDATLKTYSGQTMTGSETGCEGFWSLNNTLADLSANANTLTAGGGALATNVDSPFGNYLGGTLEYAIITKTAFSTNTTLTVQVPEGCAIPTSGGVSAVAYSTQKAPYGMPVDSGRWEVKCVLLSTVNTSGTTINTTYNPGGFNMTFPVGDWSVKSDMFIVVTPNASTVDVYFGLSSSSSAFDSSDLPLGSRVVTAQAAGSNSQAYSTNRAFSLKLSTATPYYFLLRSTMAFTFLGFRGAASTTLPEATNVTATPTYL